MSSGIQKTVVVTGGAGFIGSHLSSMLAEKGHNVHLVDTRVGTVKRALHPKTFLHNIDVRNGNALRGLFHQLGIIDAVFHLAALPSVPFSIEHPQESHDVNVNGTLAVLEAGRSHGVGRVVFSSSCAVYGDAQKLPINEEATALPQSPYALQKRIGEEYCDLYSREFGLPTVILRYFNVYGPGADPYGPYASAIGRFIEMRRKGEPMTITGDGEQTRDMIHVRDIASANILAFEHPSLGNAEIINIGSGTPVSVNTIAAHIGGPRTFTAARREIRHSCADITRAKKLLGWEPKIAMEQGIDELKREAELP